MKEPKRKLLSDEQILAMLISKEIVVNFSTQEVFHNGKLKTPSIVGTEGKNGTRYRIEIYTPNYRRSIVRAKLIYMAAHRILIPKGFEIHHVDEDRYNDDPNNLIMLTKADHLKLHNKQPTTEVPF